MQRVAKFLFTAGLGIILTIGFTGCEDKRPVYKSGMTKKQYGEEFGNWFGNKIADNANEAQIEEYKEKTSEVINQYKQKVQTLKSQNEILNLTDNMIKNILLEAKSTYNLNEDDWNYIADPEVDDSASKQSQLEIKFALQQMMAMFPTYKVGYFPSSLGSVIKEALKNNDEAYYNILKHSKYKTIIQDNSWLKEYEVKNLVLDTAINIAKSDKLYFNIKNYDKVKNYKNKIDKVSKKYNFKIIDNQEVVKYGLSIFELEKIVKSTNQDAYKNKISYMSYAIRDLDNAKKHLTYDKKHALPSNYYNKNMYEASKNKIINDEKQVKKFTEKLKVANKKFDMEYNKDIKDLNNIISKIKKLESDKNKIEQQYYHNVKVFLKTWKTLLNQGISNNDISNYLSNGRTVLDSLDKYDLSKNYILQAHRGGWALEEYLKNIQIRINNKAK